MPKLMGAKLIFPSMTDCLADDMVGTGNGFARSNRSTWRAWP
jgi:hypothetical protein